MRWVKLGDVMREKVTSLDPRNYKDETFNYYSIPAYDSGKPFLEKGKDIGSSKKVLRKGDVLISRIVPHIRRSWVVEDNLENRNIGSSEWIVFNSEQVLPNYLKHFLLSDIFNQQFMKTITGVGGSLLRANKKQTERIEIPLPSLSEQRAIVERLDRAQRLIDIDREMLQRYDDLIQSVFLDMFGDPVRNPKGWEVRKLGDVVDKLVAGKSFKSTDNEFGEYHVLKTGAVSWSVFNKLESKPLPPDYVPPKEHLINAGDILISRMNTSELVGASVLVQENISGYAIPDRIWKVVWKSKDSQSSNFFWRCINHSSFRNEISKIATGTSGSMKNMSKSKMFNMEIILPSITLQHEFDRISESLENQKKNATSSLRISELLFSSLVQQAFSKN